MDIKENRERISNKKPLLPLQYYEYTIKNSDTIFSVSARFNLTYDTIATLNGIENQLFFESQKSLVLPSCQGIFSRSPNERDACIEVNIGGGKLYFYPGKTFTGKERLNFLVTPFSSPLKNSAITSEFGYRENPFTGNREFHSGLDMKASDGTRIFAPYKGVINNIGYSDFYGNYLIILHPNGYSTHYYHLSKINNKIGESVEKGDFIALTGNTGKSTGPHLHFEIHSNGDPINPRILLGEV